MVKIDRNQVRIGIEAPGHVPVYREEILPMARVAADRESLAVGCLNRADVDESGPSPLDSTPAAVGLV